MSCLVPRAGAADYYVSMDFYEFNPSYLEIQVGDTVWWRNDDFYEIYSSVSTQGYWDTGDLYPGEVAGPHGPGICLDTRPQCKTAIRRYEFVQL